MQNLYVTIPLAVRPALWVFLTDRYGIFNMCTHLDACRIHKGRSKKSTQELTWRDGKKLFLTLPHQGIKLKVFGLEIRCSKSNSNHWARCPFKVLYKLQLLQILPMWGTHQYSMTLTMYTIASSAEYQTSTFWKLCYFWGRSAAGRKNKQKTTIFSVTLLTAGIGKTPGSGPRQSTWAGCYYY